MNRSIFVAALALATACMTGPYDGQIATPGSSITFSGYLERPNEQVRISVVAPDGSETQLDELGAVRRKRLVQLDQGLHSSGRDVA